MAIIIIEPTPGATTQDRLLALIQDSPQGITITEASKILNRPVLVIHHYQKLLASQRQIYTQLSDDGKYLICYPGLKPRKVRSQKSLQSA